MTGLWTHGKWTVRAGREDEFVSALSELSQAVSEELAVPVPTLLRDRDQPNLFLTFSRWENEDEIELFRTFLLPRLDPVRELLEEFVPHTLDEITLDG
jgi:quinol monooxygenase YgiN